MNRHCFVAAFFLISTFSAFIKGSPMAHGAENVPTGRYSELKTTATTDQLWPLANVISLRFDGSTRVAGAIKQALSHAGYQLHPHVWHEPALSHLLNLTLPSVHKSFDRMAVQEIVHALVGSSLDILVDPVKRYVSFDVSQQPIHD